MGVFIGFVVLFACLGFVVLMAKNEWSGSKSSSSAPSPDPLISVATPKKAPKKAAPAKKKKKKS